MASQSCYRHWLSITVPCLALIRHWCVYTRAIIFPRSSHCAASVHAQESQQLASSLNNTCVSALCRVLLCVPSRGSRGETTLATASITITRRWQRHVRHSRFWTKAADELTQPHGRSKVYLVPFEDRSPWNGLQSSMNQPPNPRDM